MTLILPYTVEGWVQDAKSVWINNLFYCESGIRDVTILDTNNKYSYGWGQFQMATWLSFGAFASSTKDNIHDFYLQHKVARSMLDAGGQNHWKTCAASVTKKYGPYPASAVMDT